MVAADASAVDVKPAAGFRIVLSICILSAFVAQGFVISPIFYGAMAESRGYGAAELGKIASLGGVGGVLTALTSPIWLPFAPLRQTAIALVSAAAASLLCLLFLTRTPTEAMLAMGVQGVATGALYTLMFGALSLYSRPERTLAWKLGTESKPGIAMLYLVSNYVAPRAGFPGVVGAMLCAAFVAAGATFLLPTTPPNHTAPTTMRGSRAGSPELWLAVGAATLLWTGVNSVWTFVERIGAARGLAAGTIGTVLTVGWLFASLGALAVVAIGNRFGTLKPFLLGAGVTLLALALFQGSTFASFAIATNLFITAAIFAAVYAIAQIATLNTHPLFSGLGSVALQGAIAAGAPIGGYLFESRGASGAFGFCAACTLLSSALYVGANLQAKTHRADLRR